jgi:hypothetical protein
MISSGARAIAAGNQLIHRKLVGQGFGFWGDFTPFSVAVAWQRASWEFVTARRLKLGYKQPIGRFE